LGLGLGFGLALAPGFGLRVGAGVRAGVTAQPAKVSSFDVRAASSAAMKKVLSPGPWLGLGLGLAFGVRLGLSPR